MCRKVQTTGYTRLTAIMTTALRPQATALITGAASGVGFALARLFRERGLHLALLDNDSASLQKAKQILAAANSSLKTEAYAIDVSDRTAWSTVASQVQQAFGGVDLLVLNAGKSYKAQGQSEGQKLKQWEDVEYWKRTYDTNVY
ncbi:NADP(+)-dependent dehydrogenase, partial [Rasamsonia emersonii CBS 393.64]